MATTFDDFPIELSINVVQDQDWSKQFTYKINNSAVNLNNYSAEFLIFDDFEKIYITRTSAASGVALGGAAGTITPSVPNDLINALKPASYQFILWLINPSGDRLPFAVGRWNVRKAVSA